MGFAFFPILSPSQHTLSRVLFQPPSLAPSVPPRINAVSRKPLSKTSSFVSQPPFEGHVQPQRPSASVLCQASRAAQGMLPRTGKTREFHSQTRQQLQERWVNTSNLLSLPNPSSPHTRTAAFACALLLPQRGRKRRKTCLHTSCCLIWGPP